MQKRPHPPLARSPFPKGEGKTVAPLNKNLSNRSFDHSAFICAFGEIYHCNTVRLTLTAWLIPLLRGAIPKISS